MMLIFAVSDASLTGEDQVNSLSERQLNDNISKQELHISPNTAIGTLDWRVLRYNRCISRRKYTDN
jgi:hypothetical protein